MNTGWTRLAKSALIAGIVGILFLGGLTWYGNREVPAPTLAEHRASYQRAVGWVHANEARMLKDPNSALWGMIRTAADLTQDAYLQDLVRRAVALNYGDTVPASPWKRIVDPKAQIGLNLFSLRPFEPYQRFFYHAVTCQPVVMDDGSDSNDFFRQDLCHPLATQVYLKDAVCSTHQLMGLQLLQRTGCAAPPGVDRLRASLLSDIGQQMRQDNILMKDAYIQRVLMLSWVGGPGAVKPAWMRRVLDAQQADGGWIGKRHMPELPDWMQVWRLSTRTPPTNFHATAQGLLISALAIAPAGSAPH